MRRLRKFVDTPIIGKLLKALMRLAVNREVTKISSHFSLYFYPKIANTPELKRTAFEIRHNVYCDELSFLEKSPTGLEQDHFDEHSWLCMIQHKNSKKFAGTVRMVYSTSEDQRLPIEEYCGEAIRAATIHPNHFRRDEICEISRLAVPEAFRRRSSDQHKSAAIGTVNEESYSEKELRCFPFIAVGLYLSAASMALNSGRQHCFVMMEPRLARSLSFVGIKFVQIGSAIEYHGKRAPYYINGSILLENLSPGFKRMLRDIQKVQESQRWNTPELGTEQTPKEVIHV